MFRLTKINNSRTNIPEFLKIKFSNVMNLGQGNAVYFNGESPQKHSTDDFPKYIVVGDYNYLYSKYIPCFEVTEDMVFLVEYTSSLAPKIGMRVGLTTMKSGTDSVGYDVYGKGRIVEVASDKLVYVKFTKEE